MWCFNAVYLALLVVASPWLMWRFVVQQKNRRGWSEKLLGRVDVPADSRPRIWFHAVSVGEVNLLKRIVHQWHAAHPDHAVVITTSTETGFDLAQKLFAAHHSVSFCPQDFSWAMGNAMQRIAPAMIVLAELELWPNLIAIADAKKIPVAVINGRLSESSFRGYRRFSWLLATSFRQLSIVAAQNETYAQRFREVGCEPSRVVVSGNLKFDGARTKVDHVEHSAVRQFARDIGLSCDNPILVAGSTQIEDERVAIEAFQKLKSELPNLRLVIVPRHPGHRRLTVNQITAAGLIAHLRSEHAQANLGDEILIACRDDVMVVDVIGELSGWWSIANIALVGGSFGSRGGQNMIEPAALGVPVCFGPGTRNFRQTVSMLLKRDAATVVHDADELSRFVQTIVANPDTAREMGGEVVKSCSTTPERPRKQFACWNRWLPIYGSKRPPARRHRRLRSPDLTASTAAKIAQSLDAAC